MGPPDAERPPGKGGAQEVAHHDHRPGRGYPYLYNHDHQVDRARLVVNCLEAARIIIDLALIGAYSLDDAPHAIGGVLHPATIETLAKSLDCTCSRCSEQRAA